MSTNPTDSSDPLFKGVDTDKLLDRIASEHLASAGQEQLLERLITAHTAGELSSNAVRNATAEIITGRQNARELFDRHSALNRAKQIAFAIVMATRGQRDMLRTLQRDLPLEGCFLEDDVLQNYESMLEDPDWVVAHAGGQIRDARTMDWMPFQHVADMQLHLPKDDPQAPLVTSIPNPDDPYACFLDYDKAHAKQIASEIRSNHAIAACIHNVGVYPQEYRNARFASMARSKVVDHLEKQINPKRKHPIEYLVANMFRIRGLRVESQPPKEWRLRTDIVNKVSILMHALSTQFESLYAWRIPGQDIPVQLPQKDALPLQTHIITGWESVVMFLKSGKKK